MKCEIINKIQGDKWLIPIFDENEVCGHERLPASLQVLDLGHLSKGEHLIVVREDIKYCYLHFGKNPGYADVLAISRKFFVTQKKWIGESISIILNIDSIHLGSFWFEALANGISWSDYSPKQKKDSSRLQSVYFVVNDNEKSEEYVQRGFLVAKAQKSAAHLVNTPSNIKTPEYLADWAKNLQSEELTVRVWDKEAILSEGLQAVYEVGKASAFEPRFILMTYEPKHYTHTLGLVGKGVTFDTGGVSIKPSTNLHYMKCDMGGAAAVLGAMELIADLKPSIRVIAAIPCAENALSGNAYRPGDIINSHAGKTIEIIDTDAEGRLIMADALSYLIDTFQPNTLVDIATLTGSSVATLGYEAAALFSDHDGLVQLIDNCGTSYGERVWRLPLWDAYKSDLDSDVADVRNYSGKPIAGAITAAKFLQVFTKDHPRWAHLDIAGVAFKESEFGKMKNATAYGVRLLTAIAESLASEVQK